MYEARDRIGNGNGNRGRYARKTGSEHGRFTVKSNVTQRIYLGYLYVYEYRLINWNIRQKHPSVKDKAKGNQIMSACSKPRRSFFLRFQTASILLTLPHHGCHTN